LVVRVHTHLQALEELEGNPAVIAIGTGSFREQLAGPGSGFWS
jgi:hypothetical protein